MGQLLVRDLDDEIIRRLKRRAAAHGRSVEAEHRAILEAAVRLSAEPLAVTAHRFLAELQPGGPDGADILRTQRNARIALDDSR